MDLLGDTMRNEKDHESRRPFGSRATMVPCEVRAASMVACRQRKHAHPGRTRSDLDVTTAPELCDDDPSGSLRQEGQGDGEGDLPRRGTRHSPYPQDVGRGTQSEELISKMRR